MSNPESTGLASASREVSSLRTSGRLLPESPTYRARWFLLASVCLVALVLAVAAAEIAVRYRERNRTTVPGTMPLLFYRHQRLPHALVRNADYFGWIHINSHGFRGREVTVDKPPGVVRVMAVGGSTTFDSFVSGDDRAWPARLQSWLGTIAPDRKVEVVNSGVPGYRVLDDLIRLETELYHFRPDIIILYQTHNDFLYALTAGRRIRETDRPNEAAVVTPWGDWLSRNSLFYTKLLARWQAIAARRARPSGGRNADLREAVEQGAIQFERDVSSFLSVARSLNIRVILPQVAHVSGAGTTAEPDSGVQRMWKAFYPVDEADEVLRGFALYDAVLRRAAARFGATYLPTTSFGLRGSELYVPDDPIHFNDLGADRMGRRLAEALIGDRLL
jgi:lysophospholipase L1-like esterase